MTTSTTLGRKAALTAVYAERYVLSLVFLGSSGFLMGAEAENERQGSF